MRSINGPDNAAAVAIKDRAAGQFDQRSLEAGLSELAPFHHDIELPFGLRTYLPEAARQEREQTRFKNLIGHAWDPIRESLGGSFAGKRVLDVACNCGGFSIQAARDGAAEVLGFDIDPHYVRQANFLKAATSSRNVEFQQMSIADLDPDRHGRFDVVFCFGILYHLENLIWDMRRIAAVTDGVLVVDTTLLRVPWLNRLLRQPLWNMRVVPASTEDATNVTTSRWRVTDHAQFTPNLPAVRALLGYLGFGTVDLIKPGHHTIEQRYKDGRRATLIARRSAAASP